jgi:MFS family permease
MTATATPATGARRRSWTTGLRVRRLTEYPGPRARIAYLALTVVITISLYYMAYAGSSVATLQLADLHMSFHFAIWVVSIGNFIGAAGAFVAGLSDRVGRVLIVIVGVTATSLLTLLALPHSPNRWVFAVLALLVGNIEGIVLVATPALIRDFSPQVSRGKAIGFWTLGPVVGSLIVAIVGSLTIHGTPAASFWGHEYVIAGAVGVGVSILALLFLKELAPELRDQLVVSERDRALVEIRAKGIDIEESLRHPFRQMVKPDIVISGFAVSVLLLAYYTSIALGVIIFQVVFGFTLHTANALGYWTWGINALTVVAVGAFSDRLLVRKPFMIAGAVLTAVGIVLYLQRFGHPTSFATVAVLVSLISFGMGVAYTPWMAGFTETVEDRNPALQATGLAVWGLTLRIVVFVLLILAPIVITTVTPLVNFVVRTSPYTADIQFAGAHAALISEVTQPQNARRLLELNALEKSDPSDLNAVASHTAALSPLSDPRYAAEVDAVKAHPGLFAQLAANPLDPTRRAEAVTALGGGTVGYQRLVDLATNQGLVTAFSYLQSHPSVVAFLDSNAALLSWSNEHSALIDQVRRYSTQLTALEHVPPRVQAYALANAASVERDQRLIPSQMRTWYWICFAGPVIFAFCVPLLRGRWSPRRARQDVEAHEAFVQGELDRLQLAN